MEVCLINARESALLRNYMEVNKSQGVAMIGDDKW